MLLQGCLNQNWFGFTVSPLFCSESVGIHMSVNLPNSLAKSVFLAYFKRGVGLRHSCNNTLLLLLLLAAALCVLSVVTF